MMFPLTLMINDHVVGGHDDAGGQYFDVDSVDVVGDDEDDHNGWDQLATGGCYQGKLILLRAGYLPIHLEDILNWVFGGILKWVFSVC